jgi:hypothetical protein
MTITESFFLKDFFPTLLSIIFFVTFWGDKEQLIYIYIYIMIISLVISLMIYYSYNNTINKMYQQPLHIIHIFNQSGNNTY